MATVTCNKTEFDEFWEATFGEFAKDVYCEEGPTDDQWIEWESNPSALATWSGGWFGWQGAERLPDTPAGRSVARILDDGSLDEMFERWHAGRSASRSVTISIPDDYATLASLDAWLAEHGGRR